MRPVVEYCSPAWGSLLTLEQLHCLELQQTQALKHIFGSHLSAGKLRELAGEESLGESREKAALKFAIKSRSNPRFQSWFQEQSPPRRGRRLSVGYWNYEETHFRHKNSPKNYLIRLLNNLYNPV